jgi:hypothetical protein
VCTITDSTRNVKGGHLTLTAPTTQSEVHADPSLIGQCMNCQLLETESLSRCGEFRYAAQAGRHHSGTASQFGRSDWPSSALQSWPVYAGRQNDDRYPEATDQDKTRRLRLESGSPALTLYATGTVSMLFFSAPTVSVFAGFHFSCAAANSLRCYPRSYGTYQPETRPSLAGCTMHSLCFPSWLRCTVQPSRSHRIKDLKSPS